MTYKEQGCSPSETQELSQNRTTKAPDTTTDTTCHHPENIPQECVCGRALQKAEPMN